jgi:DNA-binding GntR family transcriptional regulator
MRYIEVVASPIRGVQIRRRSTVDAAVDAIREQILEGAVPPGTALREADLCEVFGVSRATIRSALLNLSHEGLVRLEPNRGAIVPDLSPEDIDDIYSLRSILEQEAGRRLAGRDEELGPIRDAMAAIRDLPDDSPWGVVRDADLNFHRVLVMSGLRSERALRVMDSLLSELRLCFRQIRYEFESHSGIVAQHEVLVEALEEGDPASVAELIHERIDRSRLDIRRRIEERGDGSRAY